MAELDGQVAIVTGAGRGIGRAIALKLAQHGADVACVSRTAENSEKVAAEIRDPILPPAAAWWTAPPWRWLDEYRLAERPLPRLRGSHADEGL